MELAAIAWIPLTIASLINATIALIKLRVLREPIYLLSFITYMTLSVAFALLAISAHSAIAPFLHRAELSVYIRTFVFVGGISRCVLAIVQSNIKIERGK